MFYGILLDFEHLVSRKSDAISSTFLWLYLLKVSNETWFQSQLFSTKTAFYSIKFSPFYVKSKTKPLGRVPELPVAFNEHFIRSELPKLHGSS